MNTRLRFIGLLVFAAMIGGCAAHYRGDLANDPYGFFSGIWHGLIFPFALFTNLGSWLLGLFGFSFLDSIQIIGRPNTGLWYYVGFAIGLSAYGGGA